MAPKLNKKFAVYLFFLAIAIVFWFLNAMHDEYTTRIQATIQLVDSHDSTAKISPSEHRLQLEVKAYGFDILKYKTYPQSTVYIDIGKILPLTGKLKGKKDKFVESQTILGIIREHIGEQLHVIKIQPDTVKFTMYGSGKN